MNKLLLSTLLIFLGLLVNAQSTFICKTGKATFFSEAPMENIDATSKFLASALNTETKKFVFKVKISTFQFKKALMQEHFNENYMESDKYPTADFDGKITDDVDLSKDGTYEVNVEGKLTIHNVTKERTIKGQLMVENGKITGTSEFLVKVADHDIKIPSMLFKNIAEEVLVKVELDYEAKN